MDSDSNRCMLCFKRCAGRYCSPEHEARGRSPAGFDAQTGAKPYCSPVRADERPMTDDEIAKADRRALRAEKAAKKQARRGKMKP